MYSVAKFELNANDIEQTEQTIPWQINRVYFVYKSLVFDDGKHSRKDRHPDIRL